MNSVKIFLLALFCLSLFSVDAQVEQITLEQTPGAFTTESVVLTSGDYQFLIANKDVDHEVGFVLVPKGKYGQEHHIKNAYVKETVATGKSSETNVVNLPAGEYEYFCPMNPTPKYALTVRDDVKVLQMDQTPGKFTQQALTISEGSYQFVVANDDVDGNVGFVLVPKGKYSADDHIKSAYVTAPVSTGSSSRTGVVDLKAGEYEYFCPLNKTPKYTLTVVK